MPGGLDVFQDQRFEVMPHRNLARLAALLLEVQHPLIAGMIKIREKPGDGAGTRGGVNQNGDDGAIAESNNSGSFNGGE